MNCPPPVAQAKQEKGGENVLEVKDVGVVLDGAEVLSGCSFSLAPAEIVALTGDNGCGKSTLGRVLCAAQLVDEGCVVVDGHDPSASERERLIVRSLVGRVCQDPVDQIVSSLVFDEIAFGPRNLGLSEEEVSQRVDCALRRVGLSGFQDRVTTALSGGEQQRIALAGVLAMTPRYLVLDEPTAQLDPAVRESLRTLFRTLVHEDGIGVALITHDPLEIALADRIVDVASINGALGASESACRASSGPQAVQHSFGSCTGREAARCRAVATPCDAPILEVGGVSFSYGDRAVLKDISFSLHAGEVVLLTGASGAGKSTLASLVAGLVSPDAGSIRLHTCVDTSSATDDAEASPAHPVPGSVGLSFQQPEAQFFLETVYDEVAYAPRNLFFSEGEVDRRVFGAIDAVGLDRKLADASPFELSGGQARRVALASVLSLDAPLYVLDEPSAALDARGRAFAHRFVTDLAAEGRSVLVITHDVDEWRPFATRELMLSNGSLHAARAPEGPSDASLQPFAGDSAMGHASRGPQAFGTVFGEYVPGTPVARLDARVKIVLLLLATAGVFSAGVPAMLVVWLLILCGCLASSRMRLGRVLRGIRPVAVILAFTLVANLVSCDGRGTVELVGAIGLSPAGGLRGLMAITRILLLVGFSLVVASSTTATQLSDACVRLLSPLARFGVSVGPLGTVLAVALRFIPLVSEELNRIRLAQRARGAQFDAGPLFSRIGVWASVFTPLMIGLFRRADRLAEAMSARCYDSVAAGKLPAPRRLAPYDRLVLALGAALVLVLTILGLCW